MQKHTKIYLDYFGLHGEPVFCEVCGAISVDTHHINGRGPGKDVIENLMALCRYHHDNANTAAFPKAILTEIHMKKVCPRCKHWNKLFERCNYVKNAPCKFEKGG